MQNNEQSSGLRKLSLNTAAQSQISTNFAATGTGLTGIGSSRAGAFGGPSPGSNLGFGIGS